MAKKGAIGISVEMLVVIIISLVVLSAGITLLYKFMAGAEDLRVQLDQRTTDEIQRLLIDEGKRVALPLHVTDLYPGESHIFGLGILNIDATQEDFYLNIQLDKAVDSARNDLSSQVQADKWSLYNTEKMVIPRGAHRQEPIFVTIPAATPKGTYIFNVNVFNDADKTQQYYNTMNFIINVR